MGEGAFLLVEDDVVLVRSLRRLLTKHAPVRSATTYALAVKALSEHESFCAFIIDVRLPDGSGLDLLAHARESHVFTPALVLSGYNDRRQINRAFELGASFVCKPGLDLLRRFAEDAAATEPVTARDIVSRVITTYARRHDLTAAETALITAAVTGLSPHEYMEQRDITENTYRTQVKFLVKKVGAVSFSSIRDDILRKIAKL